MTGWPIVKSTERAMVRELKLLMKEEILRLFGAPKIVVSGNATFFIAQGLQEFIKVNRTSWRTV